MVSHIVRQQLVIITTLLATTEATILQADLVPLRYQVVARTGDQTDVPGVTFGQLGDPVINNAGQVAFYAVLQGSEVSNANNQGLWIGPAGDLKLLVREGDPAPNTNRTFAEGC